MKFYLNLVIATRRNVLPLAPAFAHAVRSSGSGSHERRSSGFTALKAYFAPTSSCELRNIEGYFKKMHLGFLPPLLLYFNDTF
jgi:hypothetical protein